MPSLATPATPSRPETPAERLEKLSKMEGIHYGDAIIKFNYEKGAAGDGLVTISIANTTKNQGMTYSISGADAKDFQIIEIFHALKAAASFINSNTENQIIGALKSHEEIGSALKKITDLGGALNKPDLITESNRPEAFKLLGQLDAASDPSLHGFKLHKVEPATDADHVRDIRRRNQRVVLKSDNGDFEVELQLGKRKEIAVRVPAGPGRAGKTVIGIELDGGLGDAEIVEKIKEILPDLNGKNGGTLFTGNATSQGDPLVQKLLGIGKLSCLENADLKNLRWGNKIVSEKLFLNNITIDNSDLMIYGSFYARDLITTGNTHLLLHSPSSVLENVIINEGTVLSRDATSDSSGLRRAVFVGDTRIHGNAYHCDLRELSFRDKLSLPAREPKWEDFKGMIYNRALVTDLLSRMGRGIEANQFAEVLRKLDDKFPPNDIGTRLQAMGFNVEPGEKWVTASGEDWVDGTSKGIKTLKISAKDASGGRRVEIFIPQDDKARQEDPKSRIKILTYYVDAQVGRRQEEATTTDAFGALSLSSSWLNWTVTAPRIINNAGAEVIPKTGGPVDPISKKLDEAFADPALALQRERLDRELRRLDLGMAEELKAYFFARIDQAKLSDSAKKQLEQFNQDEGLALAISVCRKAFEGKAERGGHRDERQGSREKPRQRRRSS